MDPEVIDSVRLNFSPGTLTTLNIILGFIMFGVALDLTLDDFKIALQRPKAFAIGVTSQFLLLPAMTFGLTQALDLAPSMALGMILIASCPGGNISNFFTNYSHGSTALSVCMTAVSTSAAIFMMPINVNFWGSMDPGTAAIIQTFELSPLDMISKIFILLGIPLVCGMLVRAKLSDLAAKMRKPFKIGSIVFFLALVGLAFQANVDFFLTYIGLFFMPIFLMNAGALSLGYGLGRLGRLEESEARAVAVEVGIQNSGFGLILIFDFFGGLGGMAMVAGWWGIWHMVSGLAVGYVWSNYFPLRDEHGQPLEAAQAA